MKDLSIGQKPDQGIRLLEENPIETIVLAKDSAISLPKMPVDLESREIEFQSLCL